MFHQKENRKFLKIEIVLLIALTTFVTFGQTPKGNEARALLPNQTIETELLSGQTHRYKITLAANEFLQVRVEQKGVDVIVKLSNENKKSFAQMDSPNLKSGFEILSWVADKAGTYEIEIIPFESQTKPGKYSLQRIESRTATENDRKRVENERMFLEAMRLHSAREEAEQAKILPLLDKVFQGWKQLEDDYMSKLTERQYLYVKVAQNESINQRDLSIYLNYTKEKLQEEAAAIVKAGLIFRKLQAKRYDANLLLRYGYINTLLGEVEIGLKSFNKALSIQKSIGYKRGEAISHFIIGRTLYLLGENQKGLDYLTKALDVFRNIGEKAGEALALANLGSVYENLGEYKKALEFYDQAVEKAKIANDDFTYFDTWEAIANLAVYGGKSQIVVEYYEKILEFRKQVGDKRGEANTLHSLAFAYNEWNEKQNALEYYQQSVLISKVIGYKQGEAVTFNNLMFVYDSLNQSSLAIFFGKQATNKYQELRQSIQGLDKETQKKFLNTIEGTYQKLADLLVAQGRFAEAQQVLVLLKEEEYFGYVRRDADEIKNLKGNIKLKPDEQKLIERYNLLANKVTEIGAEFQRLDDKKRKLPEGVSLPEAEQKRYEELTAQLNDANAAFKLFLEKELIAELGKPVKKEIDIDRALQEKLRSWGEGTVALYTIAGEDRYRVILTTPTVQVDGKTEIKSADLNKKIFAFRAALQNPAIDPRPLGKELYDILVKPIEKDLQAANAKTLIWSLDGTLRYLPLAALSPDGKTYLVEKYQTALITSTTRQSLMAENEKDWHTLGLGVSTEQTVPDPILPDEKITFSALPGVKTELAMIVKDEQTPNEKGLLAGKRLIDADFNPKNFGDSLTKETPEGKRKYTIVHIASHFRLSDNSANSFLLLGGGNTLTLEQISNSPQMRFGNVELVTLSACNTAFGSDSTGKEVDSLATFIELRGAKAIIATLWSVSDDSTQLLMSEFYRLHKENPTLTKAKAMQKAQIEMVEGKLKSNGKGAGCRAEIIGQKNGTSFKCDANAPYSHPFYWSPFVLIGNWR